MAAIVILVMLATLVWFVSEGPLRHVWHMVHILWGQTRPDVTEVVDLAEYRPPPRRTWSARVLVATLLGSGALGVSLYPTTLDFRTSRQATSAMHVRYNQSFASGAETMAVAGFPWRGVEGHGGGGWTSNAEACRTDHAMIFNFVCLTVIASVIAFVIPRRWLGVLLPAAVVVALAGGYAGLHWCVVYWD